MKKRSIVLTIISLALFMTFSCYAQGEKNLEVSVKFDQKSVILAEPVYVTFYFRNTGKELLEFRSRLDLMNDIRMRVSIPNRAPQDYLGVKSIGFTPYYVYKIPPGKVYSYTITVLYDEGTKTGLLVNQPGTLTVKVLLDGLVGRDPVHYSFKPISIQVRKPSKEDLKSLRLIGRKSIIKDIHEGLARPENRKIMEKFIHDFPGSTYRRYVLYSLANGYASTRARYAPNFHRAAQLFKQYIKEYPGTSLTDNAVLNVAEAYEKLKDEKNARKWIIRLYNNYPESDVNNRSNRLLQKYVYSLMPESAPRGLWMLYETPTLRKTPLPFKKRDFLHSKF